MAMRHHRQNERGQGGGVLRNWLRSVFLLGEDESVEESPSPPISPPDPPADPETEAVAPARDDRSVEPGGVLLPFPIRGEALLLRLAELLRGRFGDDGPRHDPFLFALSRRQRSRLTLDCQSYVEFVASRAEFRFAIDVAPNTSITITTSEFEALVEFVEQYVAARLTEAPALEVAS